MTKEVCGKADTVNVNVKLAKKIIMRKSPLQNFFFCSTLDVLLFFNDLDFLNTSCYS